MLKKLKFYNNAINGYYTPQKEKQTIKDQLMIITALGAYSLEKVLTNTKKCYRKPSKNCNNN